MTIKEIENNNKNNNDRIKVGKTVCRVFRKVGETTKQIHQGVIIQNCGPFVRIFNNRDQEEGGDVNQLSSELFPLKSDPCFVTFVGELEEAIEIAPQLR